MGFWNNSENKRKRSSDRVDQQSQSKGDFEKYLESVVPNEPLDISIGEEGLKYLRRQREGNQEGQS